MLKYYKVSWHYTVLICHCNRVTVLHLYKYSTQVDFSVRLDTHAIFLSDIELGPCTLGLPVKCCYDTNVGSNCSAYVELTLWPCHDFEITLTCSWIWPWHDLWPGPWLLILVYIHFYYYLHFVSVAKMSSKCYMWHASLVLAINSEKAIFQDLYENCQYSIAFPGLTTQ